MTRSVASAGAALTRLAPLVTPAGGASDRVVTAVLSDETVDRNDTRIFASAWQDEIRARRRVPLLFAGDAANVDSVLGDVGNLRLEGSRLIGDLRFMPADVNPAAETVRQMYAGGWLSAAQPVYIATEASRAKAPRTGVDVTKLDLLAWAAVPIPVNPNALTLAKAAGVDLRPLAAFVGRSLEQRTLNPMARHNYELIQRAASAAVRAAIRPPTVPAAPAAPLWRNFGEFAIAVAASADGREPDTRLVRAPSGLTEVDPTGAGFTVPDEFAKDLIEPIFDEEAMIAPWCRRLRMEKPTAHVPGVDETSRATGSRWGGVQSYWLSEGYAPPTSLPKFKNIEFAAHKLVALCIATDEVMSDASMFSDYVRRGMVADMAFQLDQTIVGGSGAGLPQGLLQAGALLTIARDAGQATKTITPSNIENMWAALPIPSRRRAIWLAHENVEAQISAVQSPGLSASQVGMYLPQGVGGNEFPLLKGRPVIVIEQAKPVGSPGDLILFDPTTYAVAAMDPRMEISAEVDWTSDQIALRLVWRIDGRPLYSSAITSYSDSTLRSPYVALAQR